MLIRDVWDLDGSVWNSEVGFEFPAMDVIRVQPLNGVAEESRFDFVVDHFADFIDGLVSSPEMVGVGRIIGDPSGT